MKIIYKFNCACGCGQQSDELGKEYIRLKATQKWVAKGCEKNSKIIKAFKGGFIIEKGDFLKYEGDTERLPSS